MNKLPMKATVIYFYKCLYPYAVLCAIATYGLVSVGNAKFGPPHSSLITLMHQNGIYFSWSYWIMVLCSGLFLVYIWSLLQVNSYRYELSKEGFYEEQGLVLRTQNLFKYEDIKETQLSSFGIYSVLGIGTLKLRIASDKNGHTSSHTVAMGLSVEAAKRLQKDILDFKSRSSHS